MFVKKLKNSLCLLFFAQCIYISLSFLLLSFLIENFTVFIENDKCKLLVYFPTSFDTVIYESKLFLIGSIVIGLIPVTVFSLILIEYSKYRSYLDRSLILIILVATSTCYQLFSPIFGYCLFQPYYIYLYLGSDDWRQEISSAQLLISDAPRDKYILFMQTLLNKWQPLFLYLLTTFHVVLGTSFVLSFKIIVGSLLIANSLAIYVLVMKLFYYLDLVERRMIALFSGILTFLSGELLLQFIIEGYGGVANFLFLLSLSSFASFMQYDSQSNGLFSRREVSTLMFIILSITTIGYHIIPVYALLLIVLICGVLIILFNVSSSFLRIPFKNIIRTYLVILSLFAMVVVYHKKIVMSSIGTPVTIEFLAQTKVGLKGGEAYSWINPLRPLPKLLISLSVDSNLSRALSELYDSIWYLSTGITPVLLIFVSMCLYIYRYTKRSTRLLTLYESIKKYAGYVTSLCLLISIFLATILVLLFSYTYEGHNPLACLLSKLSNYPEHAIIVASRKSLLYFLIPISFIFLGGLCFSIILESFKESRKVVKFAILIFIVIAVLCGSIGYGTMIRSYYRITLESYTVFKWLDHNTSPRAIVASLPNQGDSIRLVANRGVTASHEVAQLHTCQEAYYIWKSSAEDVFRAYLTENQNELEDYLNKYDVNYCHVDKVYLKALREGVIKYSEPIYSNTIKLFSSSDSSLVERESPYYLSKILDSYADVIFYYRQ